MAKLGEPIVSLLTFFCAGGGSAQFVEGQDRRNHSPPVPAPRDSFSSSFPFSSSSRLLLLFLNLPPFLPFLLLVSLPLLARRLRSYRQPEPQLKQQLHQSRWNRFALFYYSYRRRSSREDSGRVFLCFCVNDISST